MKNRTTWIDRNDKSLCVVATWRRKRLHTSGEIADWQWDSANYIYAVHVDCPMCGHVTVIPMAKISGVKCQGPTCQYFLYKRSEE